MSEVQEFSKFSFRKILQVIYSCSFSIAIQIPNKFCVKDEAPTQRPEIS